MSDDLALEPVVTEDGSRTWRRGDLGVTYRSLHGAASEAHEVFVKGAGLSRTCGHWRVLELGFGGATTFRATVKAALARGASLEFTSVDRSPPPPELFYDEDDAELIAAALIDGRAEGDGINLTIASCDWRDVVLPKHYFDAIFHDPFAPRVNPECWTPECFRWSFEALKESGRLVTWGAATASRQAMRDAGYVVARAPGAGRKRESTVAAHHASTLAGFELWRPM